MLMVVVHRTRKDGVRKHVRYAAPLLRTHALQTEAQRRTVATHTGKAMHATHAWPTLPVSNVSNISHRHANQTLT